jgi:predicted Fe-S protein YdhL (DUF1289 family)
MTQSATTGTPGPFEVRLEPHLHAQPSDQPLSASIESDHPPRRRYECGQYDECLKLAAALNWDSFTCRGCSGEINETLVWRARQSTKKDSVAKAICTFAPVQKFVRVEPIADSKEKASGS